MFIFWMIVLNSLYCGVAFEYFSRTFLDAVKGIGIFARDVSVIFLSVFVLDILLYCLLRKLSLIHNAVKFMLLAISAGVFIVDVFTVYYFKAPVNTTIIDVIIRTNFREGTEFMQTYLASPEIWLLFIFVAAALVLMRYLFAVICRKKSAVFASSHYRSFGRLGLRNTRPQTTCWVEIYEVYSSFKVIVDDV